MMNIIEKTIVRYIDESKSRARFFQDVHAWPLTEEFNYEGWLNNFKNNEEKYIACHLLDFFNYYPLKMINRMLQVAVGQAGQVFVQEFKDWKHSHFKTRCYYSLIPGEHPKNTDSGHIFARKIRDVLEIGKESIIDYENIYDVLENEPKPRPVVFVDDFVGSGNQCITAWNKLQKGCSKSLSDLIAERHHVCVYTPLIANITGYDLILKNCRALHLCAAHVLDIKYNLFREDCICWHNDTNLYHDAYSLIIERSKELGIPDTKGVDVYDVRGFQQQGLAIAFEHGAPDAIPAIFYCCNNNWIPLVKKSYER